jgi:hypothetical protein
MHSDCPFHLFPHVVGNRSCLVLLCHVQREAWVEVSTKSRPKFSQRKVNNNYAKHKTLVFRTQTAPLGDPQHAFSTLFRAFSSPSGRCCWFHLWNTTTQWMPLMLHWQHGCQWLIGNFVGWNFAEVGGLVFPMGPMAFIWQSLGLGDLPLVSRKGVSSRS